jgi:hypothetical protein
MSISLSGRASRSRSRIPGHTVLFDTIAGGPGGDIRRLTDVAMQIARSSQGRQGGLAVASQGTGLGRYRTRRFRSG